MRTRTRLLVLPLLLSLSNAWAASPVESAPTTLTVFSAGSLRGVLQEVERQYTAHYGTTFKTVYGPSGLLAKRIEGGEIPDLFLSADFEHPQQLAAEGKSLPPVVFARNQLCVSGRAGLGLTTSNVLDKMLDPSLKLGTSTPKSDPGGDYTWEMFSRADAIHPGAYSALSAKAHQLVGSPQSPAVPPGQNAVRYFFAQHEADMFVGYCSTQARPVEGDIEKVRVPANLEVAADYGLTVPNAPQQAAALRFALFALTPEAQSTFAAYGFQPVSDRASTAAEK
jgi:molybdate transport system substrate-binding protein